MNNKTLKRQILSLLSDYPNAFTVDQIIELLVGWDKATNLNPAKVSFVCREMVNSKQLRRIGTTTEPMFVHMDNIENLGRVMHDDFRRLSVVITHPNYNAKLGSKFINLDWDPERDPRWLSGETGYENL